MRETLKSLSIFSALLLLLLLISSGCDVNIPGCGKRSLPFFKSVKPTPLPPSVVPTPAAALSVPAPALALSKSPTATPKASVKPPGSLQAPVEMSLSKSEPTATGTPTATPTPQEVEKIAYTTLEGGKPTLWTMNTDGTNRARLTPSGTGSWFPLWSPNGKWLAFLSDMTGGKVNLFIVQKDGTGLQALTSYDDMLLPAAAHVKPPFSWSPQSDEIAFCYRNQVWKVNIETLDLQTLSSEDPAYTVSAVEWAPHRANKYVAFLVDQGKNYSILKLVNPRLKDLLTLASTDQPMVDISWTSDAREVAYLVGQDTLYSASPQTSLPRVLLNHPCPELGPLVSYSPSESSSILMLLAKKLDTDPGYRVALLDKSSTGPTDPGTLKFLSQPGVDDATWSPDGSKIAYVLSGDLWVVDATGQNAHRVALIGVQSPTWSKK